MLGRYRPRGTSRDEGASQDAPTIDCVEPPLRASEHKRTRRGGTGAKGLFIYLAGTLWLGSISAYADSTSVINQINNNADLIATQAQNNMTQQQQVLAQRLQALSAAMQAQLPNIPVQPSIPVQAPAPTVAKPVTPVPPPQTTAPQPASTQQPNVTGLAPASQNNDSNNSNQWNYGF